MKRKLKKIFRIKSRDTADQLKNCWLICRSSGEDLDGYYIFRKEQSESETESEYLCNTYRSYNFAIERFEKGINLQNALLWEIKRFYPHEFDLGSYALKLIKERLGVELPEDEAGFIALHFVNAEYGTDIRDAFRFPNQLRDILEITSDELGIVLDERTLHYERFVTHLKFLLQRVYRNELLPDEEDELAELMRTKYPKEYACSCKIAEYIEKNTECRLSSEEVMYLAIHIRRVTMAENEEQ